jgi:O-acetyl-ADP-ribose deacetylase (regulator of RNase III)
MIFEKGNLLDVESGILVHGCNCQGVWGSGVASQMKEKYPEAFKRYVSDLKKNDSARMALGTISYHEVHPTLTVFSAFTQEFYGRDKNARYVSYDALDACFYYIISYARGMNQQIYLPDLIGAGLGGGNREVILAIIEAQCKKMHFDSDNITVLKHVK